MFGLGKRKPEDSHSMTQPLPSGWQMNDLGLLGSGGMSQVYRAKDLELEREVALKVLRTELQRDDYAQRRFLDEAKITAQLDHPNIPPVYAVASDRKRSTCFTMKVLEGRSMQELISEPSIHTAEGRLKALAVLVRVCDAVAFAHSRGILHLDLKPHNVMVAEHGQIYVVDWGLARRKKDLPTKASDDQDAIGTPAYMAPEQAMGKNHALDERTDVFALGGILYRILTGRPPYVAQTAEATLELARQRTLAPPENFAPKGKTLPRTLVNIAMKAMSFLPSDRYGDVGSFRAQLEDFLHGTAHLPERHFQPGEVILREGDEGDCAYVILDGHCQATRTVAGKTERLRLMGPGEMFGEAAVLTHSPRFATVTALMETTVAVVDKSYLEEEMHRSSLMSLAIQAVAASFVDLNGQTTALLMERSFSSALDICLRELALKGQDGEGGSRFVPWSALLERLVQKTKLNANDISDRVARQPGFRIDAQSDRLILLQDP